jgi:hypothetical protein
MKKTSSNRDTIVETVSTWHKAASGTFTVLKHWAAESTKSRPIHTVSSSSSDESLFNAESVVDSKPSSRATAPPRLTSKKESPNQQVPRTSSLRDVAKDTFSGIKEWAAKLPQTNDALDAEAAGDVRVVYETNGEKKASPARAARALYVAQTNYETTSKYEIKSSPSKSMSERLSLMQDLVSPFLVCGSTQTVNDDEPVTYSTKTTQKTLVSNRHDWKNWNPVGMLDPRANSFDESILSLDTQGEEEMDQIRRLSSWGTMGTMGTAATGFTTETARTLDAGDGMAVDFAMLVQDDNGKEIPSVLLETAKKRLEKQLKRKGRKRLVHFDYPPISSVKECPRANPDDLPNLFFTEEELEQIEDDRYDTKTADDVEIVAVSSLNSQEDSFSDMRETDKHDWEAKSPTRGRMRQENTSPAKSPSGNSFSNNTSTPKMRGKQRSASPHPVKRHSNSQLNSGSPPNPLPPNASESPRLIKGVQIFLRERSTGP